MLDVLDFSHGLDSLDVGLAIVNQRFVALLLELEDGVVGELLSVGFAVGLGPGDFTGVVFGFEVAVALRTAELEHLGVVAHEGDAVARVDWA